MLVIALDMPIPPQNIAILMARLLEVKGSEQRYIILCWRVVADVTSGVQVLV